MRRSTKRFLNLAKRLDEALEKRVDLFLSQRIYIQDQSQPAEILGRNDDQILEKVDNDFLIEELNQKIQEEVETNGTIIDSPPTSLSTAIQGPLWRDE